MASPLRAAVVGVGHLGQHHARVYRELDGVELVAVVDVDEPTVKKVARKNRTEALSNYREHDPTRPVHYESPTGRREYHGPHTAPHLSGGQQTGLGDARGSKALARVGAALVIEQVIGKVSPYLQQQGCQQRRQSRSPAESPIHVSHR